MRLFKAWKYKLAKRRFKLKKGLYPEYVPNEKEQRVISIVKSLIRDDTSIMMVAPNSGKLYIRNEKKSMFIILDDIYVTLLNNKSMSYHDVIVNVRVSEKLKLNFKNVLESRRNTMEHDIVNDVVKNLDYISKHIDIDE